MARGDDRERGTNVAVRAPVIISENIFEKMTSDDAKGAHGCPHCTRHFGYIKLDGQPLSSFTDI